MAESRLSLGSDGLQVRRTNVITASERTSTISSGISARSSFSTVPQHVAPVFPTTSATAKSLKSTDFCGPSNLGGHSAITLKMTEFKGNIAPQNGSGNDYSTVNHFT
jgi:hypothetical protein